MDTTTLNPAEAIIFEATIYLPSIRYRGAHGYLQSYTNYNHSLESCSEEVKERFQKASDILKHLYYFSDIEVIDWITEQIEEVGSEVLVLKLVEFAELTEELPLEFAMDLFSWE